MERPSVPQWSHSEEKWVFEGKGYTSPRKADHIYTIRLMEYCDYLEAILEQDNKA